MDPSLNKLFKWSVENSANSSTETPTAITSKDPPTTANPDSAPATIPNNTQLDPEILSALFGGPSDADLMQSSMLAIQSADPALTLADKLIAFDNFEQLIENLDNANNLAVLGLWPPLLGCLKHEEAEIRRMAAWCVGTAVQNNRVSQESLLAMGGVEALVEVVVKEKEDDAVRRKVIYALSSSCRNFQEGMDRLTGELEKVGRWSGGKVDASSMDACDEVVGELRKIGEKESIEER